MTILWFQSSKHFLLTKYLVCIQKLEWIHWKWTREQDQNDTSFMRALICHLSPLIMPLTRVDQPGWVYRNSYSECVSEHFCDVLQFRKILMTTILKSNEEINKCQIFSFLTTKGNGKMPLVIQGIILKVRNVYEMNEWWTKIQKYLVTISILENN